MPHTLKRVVTERSTVLSVISAHDKSMLNFRENAPGCCVRESRCAGVGYYNLDTEGNHSMTISPDLLEILACPACRARVVLKRDGSGLKCVSCHRVYPIRDEIPVMLVDEAVLEPDDNPSSARDASR
jgi:uncharacterized protein YbaR (Trm112 family)